MAAVPFVGIAAPSVLAQGMSKSPTKVLDFMTNADVAKAEAGRPARVLLP